LDLIKNLNLWGNDLQDISVVQCMPNLEVLSLSVNQVSSLEDLMHCSKLTELYLRKNDICDLSEILHLKGLRNLRVLWLGDNPCATLPHYRQYVLHHLPKLEKIDSQDVSDDERRVARTGDFEQYQTRVADSCDIEQDGNEIDEVWESRDKLPMDVLAADRGMDAVAGGRGGGADGRMLHRGTSFESEASERSAPCIGSGVGWQAQCAEGLQEPMPRRYSAASQVSEAAQMRGAAAGGMIVEEDLSDHAGSGQSRVQPLPLSDRMPNRRPSGRYSAAAAGDYSAEEVLMSPTGSAMRYAIGTAGDYGGVGVSSAQQARHDGVSSGPRHPWSGAAMRPTPPAPASPMQSAWGSGVGGCNAPASQRHVPCDGSPQHSAMWRSNDGRRSSGHDGGGDGYHGRCPPRDRRDGANGAPADFRNAAEPQRWNDAEVGASRDYYQGRNDLSHYPPESGAGPDVDEHARRADNILCAVLALIKELDSQGLELVRRAVEQRGTEL